MLLRSLVANWRVKKAALAAGQDISPLPLTKIDPLALMRSDPLGSRDSGISFPRRSVLSSEEGDSEEAASRVIRREL
jgi:hypothetical protein